MRVIPKVLFHFLFLNLAELCRAIILNLLIPMSALRTWLISVLQPQNPMPITELAIKHHAHPD